MAYNSYLYPYYPQQQIQPQNYAYGQQQAPFMQNSGFTWVQGRSGAKAHYTAPGMTDLLMDSERDVFYLKTCDRNGVPQPLREYEYKEIIRQDPSEMPTEGQSYDARPSGEIEHLASQIASLSSQISEMRTMIENGGIKNV